MMDGNILLNTSLLDPIISFSLRLLLMGEGDPPYSTLLACKALETIGLPLPTATEL